MTKRPREPEPCVVCLASDASMVVRECRHACMCVNCAFGVFVRQRKCPLCRIPIITAPVHLEHPDSAVPKLTPTFVNEAITSAGCMDVEPKEIKRSLRGLVNDIPKSEMRALVCTYQVRTVLAEPAITTIGMLPHSKKQPSVGVSILAHFNTSSQLTFGTDHFGMFLPVSPSRIRRV